MKCWHCNSKLIWQSDFSYEDYGLEEEGIISVLICSNEECGSVIEVYKEI